LAPPGGGEYGLNPVWAQDAAGNWQLYQPNKGGGAPAQVQFPAGVQPRPQVSFQDLGTGIQPVTNRGGVPVGQPIPKDLAGVQEQKGIGDARVDYASIKSKMPGLETVVKQLDDLAGKATYTLSGQAIDAGRTQLGMPPSEGAVARTTYQSMVANQVLPLLRDTFGAQFTQVEGERLLATLGDPDTTPPQKQAVLKAFIEQKRRDVEALATKAGIQPSSTPDVTQMTEEQLRAIANGN
jgi:hypothetical protein